MMKRAVARFLSYNLSFNKLRCVIMPKVGVIVLLAKPKNQTNTIINIMCLIVIDCVKYMHLILLLIEREKNASVLKPFRAPHVRNLRKNLILNFTNESLRNMLNSLIKDKLHVNCSFY